MTKEEIRKVLDLALEYYKLEIFGTGKESQPPTQERIDYIYDRMQQSLPSDLDEAAKEYYYSPACSWEDNEERIINTFKAGVEWVIRQGVSLSHLIAWYIQSVDAHEPVWTKEHLEELVKDYILIPKN